MSIPVQALHKNPKTECASLENALNAADCFLQGNKTKFSSPILNSLTTPFYVRLTLYKGAFCRRGRGQVLWIRQRGSILTSVCLWRHFARESLEAGMQAWFFSGICHLRLHTGHYSSSCSPRIAQTWNARGGWNMKLITVVQKPRDRKRMTKPVFFATSKSLPLSSFTSGKYEIPGLLTASLALKQFTSCHVTIKNIHIAREKSTQSNVK